MDRNSNRNRIPAELEDIEDALRANRHEASPLELDRIKLQAIRQAAQGRPSFVARQKGAFMKSRLAMMLVIAAGFMLSTTGAGLAISGSSSSGSAAGTQYTPAGTEEHGGHQPEGQGVKGAATKGGNECAENGNGNGNGANGNGGNSGANANGNCNHTEPAAVEPAPAEVEVAPVPAEQQAVVSSGSSLPFTGFVAIPLLIIGVLMVVGGALLRLKSRKENTAA
jgi:hypothetical protein